MRGFTLIEIVIVIGVLAIAGAALANMHGSLFSSRTSLAEVQVQTWMATECMERVLAVKREDGFDEVSNGARFGTGTNGVYCDGISAQIGATPPTVTSTSFTGAACPLGATCRLATINAGPSVQLMLVSY
jgi:prepilin-type N-terminal cleavage/methylation domain-containing protein